MRFNPTTLFLSFMLITLLVVAGYLLLTDPFASPQFTHNQGKVQQNSQNPAMAVYLKNCARCHGAMGEGKGGNPSLQNLTFSEAQIQQIISKGKGEMPAFPQFSPEELSQLSRLIKQF